MNVTIELRVPEEWSAALCAEAEAQGFRTIEEYLRALIVRDSAEVRKIINSGRKNASNH